MMSKINIYIYYVTLLCSLLALESCSDTLDEANIDTDSPTEVLPSMRLTFSINQVFSFMGTGQNDRWASIFDQYLSNGDGRQTVDIYLLSGGGGGFFLYNGAFQELKTMREEIEATGLPHPHYLGVANILEAMALGSLTDAMGDIPYSNALKGGEDLNPSYDSQEKIYDDIQNLLSEAISQLGASESVRLRGDFILNNDKNSWIIFAHLLKARYYNHLSEMDPVGSAENALSEIDAAVNAGWTTGFNVEMKYEGSINHSNGYFFQQVDAPINASFNFIDDLKATNDPRLFAYFRPLQVRVVPDLNVISNGGAQILNYRPELVGKDTVVLDVIGERIGETNDLAEFGSSVGLVYSNRGSSFPVLLASEVKFIEAEALLRMSSPDNARAADAYNNAIIAHLDLVLPRMESTLSNFRDENITSTVISDGVNAILANVAMQRTNYISNYASATNATINIDDIMSQKYKAMFLQGVESWTDLRRHEFSFPEYLEVPRSAPQYIRRIPYPLSESETNGAVLPDDDIYNKLWFDR